MCGWLDPLNAVGEAPLGFLEIHTATSGQARVSFGAEPRPTLSSVLDSGSCILALESKHDVSRQRPLVAIEVVAAFCAVHFGAAVRECRMRRVFFHPGRKSTGLYAGEFSLAPAPPAVRWNLEPHRGILPR